MIKTERSRGVLVKVLDLSNLEAEALTFRQRTHPDCYQAKIYGGKIAIVPAHPTQHLYAICTEGVGPESGVSDDDPLEIEFHGSYHVRGPETILDNGDIIPGEIDPHRHTFDFMPFAGTTLTPAELRLYPVLEEVDLADFIRSFGSRLEMNYQMWYKILS